MIIFGAWPPPNHSKIDVFFWKRKGSRFKSWGRPVWCIFKVHHGLLGECKTEHNSSSDLIVGVSFVGSVYPVKFGYDSILILRPLLKCWVTIEPMYTTRVCYPSMVYLSLVVSLLKYDGSIMTWTSMQSTSRIWETCQMCSPPRSCLRETFVTCTIETWWCDAWQIDLYVYSMTLCWNLNGPRGAPVRLHKKFHSNRLGPAEYSIDPELHPRWRRYSALSALDDDGWCHSDVVISRNAAFWPQLIAIITITPGLHCILHCQSQHSAYQQADCSISQNPPAHCWPVEETKLQIPLIQVAMGQY